MLQVGGRAIGSLTLRVEVFAMSIEVSWVRGHEGEFKPL